VLDLLIRSCRTVESLAYYHLLRGRYFYKIGNHLDIVKDDYSMAIHLILKCDFQTFQTPIKTGELYANKLINVDYEAFQFVIETLDEFGKERESLNQFSEAPEKLQTSEISKPAKEMDLNEIFDLISKKEESKPYCSDLISIASVNDARGRLLIANPRRTFLENHQDTIKTGTVLISEKSFVNVRMHRASCWSCLKPVQFKFVCDSFCGASYCSFKCLRNSKNDQHYYFCKNNIDLHSETVNLFDNNVVLGLKLFLKRRLHQREKSLERTDYPYVVHALTQRSFDADAILCDEEGNTYFRGDWKAAQCLETNMRHFNIFQLSEVAWSVILLCEYFGDQFSIGKESFEDLFQCMMQVKSNQFAIKDIIKSPRDALHPGKNV
jgi:hypothetical protein